MNKSQKVALVTGGAKRVGRAIVERLGEAGFDVAFTYFSSGDEVSSLEQALRERGTDPLAVRADLSDPDAAAQIFKAVDAQYGRLDVLVNSASIYQLADLRNATTELIRKLMAVHLESPLLLAQKFETHLRTARGHIVNMLDLLVEHPAPEYLAYCTSKAALWNLTLGLARELAPEVTVNGIAPGVVAWPEDYPPQARKRYLTRVPLARAGEPKDAAELVHFLVTTGTYITGQVIRLDGGRSVT